MTDRTTTRLIATLLCTGLTARSPEPAEESRSVVLGFDELSWQALNPLRGDKSPQAATLWGDRNGLAPTGFLVRFVDGFSSPPHIHNVSYRIASSATEQTVVYIHTDAPYRIVAR